MPHTTARARTATRFARFTLSLMVLSALLIPTVYLLRPTLQRHYFISKLTSADVQLRERALNYVIRFAPDDTLVAKSAYQQLDVDDRTNFLQIVNALDHAGFWHRPGAPDDAWLRWLGVLAAEPAPDARIIALQKVTDLYDIAHDKRVPEFIASLATDTDTNVRYAALTTALEMMRHADTDATGIPYLRIVKAATQDSNLSIAHDAWLYLGTLGIKPDELIELPPSPEPVVNGTRVWAITRDQPIRTPEEIEAIASPRVRAMAAYASHSSPAIDGLVRRATARPLDPDWQWTLWRAILAADPERSADALAHFVSPDYVSAADAITEPLIYAAAYQRAGSLTEPEKLASLVAAPLVMLAVLEGAIDRGESVALAPSPGMPPLLRLAAAAASDHPRFEDFYPALIDADSALRDLACIYALQKFDTATLKRHAATLLSDFNDNAKMSGAILVGLSGARPTIERDGLAQDLLSFRAENEDVWVVKQTLELGLWMRESDQRYGFEDASVFMPLLSRDDFPRTTALLAMLHDRYAAAHALHFLFNPRGETPIDLVDLLENRRWWKVLEHHLASAENDADGAKKSRPHPPFWVWADPDLTAFQTEALRAWWAMSSTSIPKW